MQLTYRGLAYAINNQSDKDSLVTEALESSPVLQSNIGLTYRGNMYKSQSPIATTIRLAHVNLMYRGQSYEQLLSVTSAIPTPQPLPAYSQKLQLQPQV